jgi:hypothetical protein
VGPVLAAVLMVGAVGFAQVQPAPPRPSAPPSPAAPPARPAPPAPPAPAAPAQSDSDVSSGREFRMQSSDVLRNLEVRGRGAITFSDDLTDVVTMADGAYLTIRSRNWFTLRSSTPGRARHHHAEVLHFRCGPAVGSRGTSVAGRPAALTGPAVRLRGRVANAANPEHQRRERCA